MSKSVTYRKIAERMIELIDSGVFPPGSRLPTERYLADFLGVSRSHIREARIALEVLGFIEHRGALGTHVVDKEAISLKEFTNVTPLELTEARILIEAESAALAAPIITEETILELDKYISIMSGKEDSEMTPDEADAAFHNAIARSTNNNMIKSIIDRMWKIRQESAELQQVYRKVCDEDSTHRTHEHQAILQALKNRDSIAARKAMQAHFHRIMQALLEASEKKALREAKRQASDRRARFLLVSQIT